MDRRAPPPTAEGWFALHDFRTVDWDALREAEGDIHDRAVEEGRAYLEAAEAVEDADEGASAAYSVLGHKADLLLIHLRPTLAALDALERRLEQTALGAVTDRAYSYVSVTEASGYTSQAFFEEDEEELDVGLRRYMESRIRPQIPDVPAVCFYPMDKRRDPEYNWYDLPFEDRAAHMEAHGDIGREYAGDVTQIITGSIGLDDWEWGVTLFAKDPVQFKHLLYEMRFDPSSSQFAEFGPFFTGQRLAPAALGAFLAGEPLEEADVGCESGPPAAAGGDSDVQGTLADRGVYAGQPHGEDVHAVVLYSAADPDEIAAELDGLRGNFDHYDTHERTAIYEDTAGGPAAIVSIWETPSAAETAGGFLADLPGVVERPEGDGFETMGLFYTVKPAHLEDFRERFVDVGELLSDMDGHRETRLLANREDEADLFIASQWDAKDDAMAFFRSDAFRDTVDWGREILDSRPRHVFFTDRF